jgi:hypothetical protein
MSSDKHWLISFEGLRGLAYSVAIVSLIAPSLLALYLLSPTEFFALPWPLVLLLSASIGGTLGVLAVFEVVLGLRKSASIFSRASSTADSDSRRLLASAPLLGFCYQCGSLVMCVIAGASFHAYVLVAFAFGIVAGITNPIGVWVLRRVHSRIRSRKAKAPESPPGP